MRARKSEFFWRRSLGMARASSCKRLVDPPGVAAQRGALQLGDAAQLLRSESIDLVEVSERGRPASGDRQHAGEREVGIGREVVVAGLVRRRDGFVECVLGEIDLTEHSQGSSQHGEGTAELSPVVDGSGLGRDLARLAGYLGRIVPDRRGQFGQEVHVAMVRPGSLATGSRESTLLDDGLFDDCLLDDGLAAVDGNGRGVDVPRVVGGEERGELGDIVGLTDPAQRVGGGQCAAGGIGRGEQELGRRSADEAGQDRVGSDSVRPAGSSEVIGERQHAALGGAVRGLLEEGRAADRRDRGDVDDASTATRDEVRPGDFACVEDEVQLVPDTGMPVVDGQVVPRDRPPEATRCCTARRSRRGPRRRSSIHAWVASYDDRSTGAVAVIAAACIAHQLHRLVRRLRVEIAADDGGTLGGEPQRSGATHADPGPGDQRNLAGEPTHQADARLAQQRSDLRS